jgi:hypothetical protein
MVLIYNLFSGKYTLNGLLSFITCKDYCLFDTALCNIDYREDNQFIGSCSVLEFQNPLPSTLFERILQWAINRELVFSRIIVSICVDVGDIDIDLSATAIEYLEVLIKNSENFLRIFKSDFLSHTMIDNLTCCKHLKVLKIRFSNYFESIHLEPHYPTVYDVELSALKTIHFSNVPEKFMIPLLCNATNLETVAIVQTDSFNMNNNISSKFLELLPQALSTKITKLTLCGISPTLNHETAICTKFGLIFKKLHSLKFSRHSFADHVLEVILSQCNSQTITELDFYKCVKLTSGLLCSVVKHCPMVTHVDLSDCKGIHLVGVINLITNSKKLEWLDISGTSVARKLFLTDLIILIGRAKTLLLSLRMSCNCLTTEEHYRELLRGTYLKLEIRKEKPNELYSKNNLLRFNNHDKKTASKVKDVSAKAKKISLKAKVIKKKVTKNKVTNAKVPEPKVTKAKLQIVRSSQRLIKKVK